MDTTPTPAPVVTDTPAAPAAGTAVPLVLGRGIGQIFLQPSAWAGLLVLTGIVGFSWPMALVVLLGTIVSTSAGAALGRPVVAGLEGYNGALVGAAAWATFGRPAPAVLATLVGAAACPAATALVSRLLAAVTPRNPLPALTAPFCLVSGLVALLAGRLHVAPGAPLAVSPAGTVWEFVRDVLTGVSQVVLAEHWMTGLLILAGMAVAGWRIALAALLGSVVGSLTELATGASLTTLDHGLWGYSPCLTAVACITLLRPSRLRWVLAVVGAAVTIGVEALLKHTPVPVYTWPFILVTWVILAAVGRERV